MIPIVDSDKIDYYAGGLAVSAKPLQPYNDLACDFLSDVSKALLSGPYIRDFGDVAAFAYWCRKAHISQYKQSFGAVDNRLGVGLVFHIAPSNVMVNFAYSFAFGLLSGNANIVRIPSKQSQEVDIILQALLGLLAEDKYAALNEMTAFVRYDHSKGATEDFSNICNARVIWGGDETIEQIRKSPLPARAGEITFADRYSFLVMSADEIEALDDGALERLVGGFYNDTYLMDQNACSSPHLIVWTGQGSEKFWQALGDLVKNKYSLEPVQAVINDERFQGIHINAEIGQCLEFWRNQRRQFINVTRVIFIKSPEFSAQIIKRRWQAGELNPV